jgi:hypothetical protein
MVAVMASACTMGPDRADCEQQCRILGSCGGLDAAEVPGCVETCVQMLDGMCAGPGCVPVGPGGDPAACSETLLEANGAADGDICTDSFIHQWCGSYYEDPACAPLVVHDLGCS